MTMNLMRFRSAAAMPCFLALDTSSPPSASDHARAIQCMGQLPRCARALLGKSFIRHQHQRTSFAFAIHERIGIVGNRHQTGMDRRYLHLLLWRHAIGSEQLPLCYDVATRALLSKHIFHMSSTSTSMTSVAIHKHIGISVTSMQVKLTVTDLCCTTELMTCCKCVCRCVCVCVCVCVWACCVFRSRREFMKTQSMRAVRRKAHEAAILSLFLGKL